MILQYSPQRANNCINDFLHFWLLLGLYFAWKCENSNWGLGFFVRAKAFLIFCLDVDSDSLYQDKIKYILQDFAYQEAVIRGFLFTVLVETTGLRDLSCCLEIG